MRIPDEYHAHPCNSSAAVMTWFSRNNIHAHGVSKPLTGIAGPAAQDVVRPLGIDERTAVLAAAVSLDLLVVWDDAQTLPAVLCRFALCLRRRPSGR